MFRKMRGGDERHLIGSVFANVFHHLIGGVQALQKEPHYSTLL
ncbi:MAG: hypothetical protein ACI9W4_001065 [Rhodothermales bacterium]|jgi:hypothetical protein